ncbi:ribonuclease H-like domain-containing protein [Tanacetum coccineum]
MMSWYNFQSILMMVPMTIKIMHNLLSYYNLSWVLMMFMTTEPLPTIKEAFSLLSMDESHRTMYAGGSKVKGSTSAFNSTPNDNKGVLLLLFPGLKKGVTSQNVISNGSVNDKDTSTGASTSHTLTSNPAMSSVVFSFLSSKFFNKHMNISTYSTFVGWIIDSRASQHITFTIEFLFNIIDVSHLNITVAHPNGTIAKVNQIGSCKITDKIILHDVLVIPRIHFSSPRLGHPSDQVLSVLKDKINLKSFQSSEPCEPSEHYDDERDPSNGGGTYSSFIELAVESASARPTSTVNPFAFTNNKGVDSSNTSNFGLDSVDKLGNIIAEGGADDDGAAVYDNENIYEGEGLDLYNFDMLFQENVSEDRTKEGQSIRRSSRKSVLPTRLKDYVLDGKVKYGINIVVNYSNLSCDNFSFVTSLNKTCEPKSFKEAVLDSKWVDAMNSEIKALNRNITWVITDLPEGRKPIRTVQNDWNVYQLDINNAFLYRELDEDVYMSLSEGYFSKNDKRVSKLEKSLYGLKQAPKKWNEKLTYDLGDLKYFLGIEVIKNGHGICLSQRKYSLELLNEFGMLACKPFKIPLLDISYVVHKLSQVMHAPKRADMKSAFKVLSSAMQIAANPVFHERTKHFKIDLFFLREKIDE